MAGGGFEKDFDEKDIGTPSPDRADTSSSSSDDTSTRHGDVEKGPEAPVEKIHRNRWAEIRAKRTWNPLRWQRAPPVPAERSVSGEAKAGVLSQITFSWMTDLMTVRI